MRAMERSTDFELRQEPVGTARVRLADYVAQRIAEHGIRHVFMLTGGGAMHLNDALGRAEGLQYVCCHHEQAAAMAAESYARLSGRMAAVNVTTARAGSTRSTAFMAPIPIPSPCSYYQGK